PDTGDWPGKNRLTANLGLYFILDGRDQEGLLRLHEAEASFEARAQWEDLASALTNEAACLRVAGRSDDADVIQKRADEALRKAGVASIGRPGTTRSPG
ncbi:MAG: hypothetical protein ABSH20_24235, partial [Tepidisphaeraceae bacterium]